MRGAGVIALLVVVQFLQVGLNTMIKASLSKGMSNYVFVAYSNLFAFCFLLPSTIFYYRFAASTKPNNSLGTCPINSPPVGSSNFPLMLCLIWTHRNKALPPINTWIIFRIFVMGVFRYGITSLVLKIK